MLDVTFVRRRGSRDRVYVSRREGTSTGWDFPSYGDGLPHDLCHLVVEDGLGLRAGFWGLVDAGVEVGLVDNQATLLRDGKPYADQPGVDLTGLMEAEAAVAVLGAPIRVEALETFVEGFTAPLPDSLTDERRAGIRRRLDELAARWRTLDDGESITLSFPTQPV